MGADASVRQSTTNVEPQLTAMHNNSKEQDEGSLEFFVGGKNRDLSPVTLVKTVPFKTLRTQNLQFDPSRKADTQSSIEDLYDDRESQHEKDL